MASEGPGESDLINGVDSEIPHEQLDAGIEGGFGKLDRPDIGLGDQYRRTSVENVGAGAAVCDDPLMISIDHTVPVDHAGEVELGDGLDYP